MDNLDFLDGGVPVEPTAAVETPAAPVAEPSSEGPARGPDGKFVSKSAEPAQAEAPQPAPAPAQPETPAAPPPGYVPQSVVKELRDEIRALKQQPQPQQYEYPAEPLSQEEFVQHQTLNTRLDMSEELARDKFGDEVVDAARDWALQKFQSNPAYRAEVLSQRNPYRRIVEDHEADQKASKLNALGDDDIEAFLAWRAQQAGQPAAAPVAAPQPPSPPPRSIASAPNAGGTKPGQQPVGPGVAFDSVFRN